MHEHFGHIILLVVPLIIYALVKICSLHAYRRIPLNVLIATFLLFILISHISHFCTYRQTEPTISSALACCVLTPYAHVAVHTGSISILFFSILFLLPFFRYEVTKVLIAQNRSPPDFF